MLEKFKGRIDWTGLSGVSSENLLIPDVVERFKDCWDWKVLSGNNNLPIATIRKMADYIDWKELINSFPHLQKLPLFGSFCLYLCIHKR